MPQLFLDCDGVLADFEGYSFGIFGLPSRAAEAKLGPERFWLELSTHESFYRKLPLLGDARVLFDGVRHLNPIILTGCPEGGWAEEQKQDWAAQHFPGTKMITCMPRNKRDHMKPGDVLVDDYLKYKDFWEQAGGIFVHHTSAAESLRKLSELGFDIRRPVASKGL